MTLGVAYEVEYGLEFYESMLLVLRESLAVTAEVDVLIEGVKQSS